jgi:hypothetical protein
MPAERRRAGVSGVSRYPGRNTDQLAERNPGRIAPPLGNRARQGGFRAVNCVPWGAVMVTGLWPWFRVCGRHARPAQAGRGPGHRAGRRGAMVTRLLPRFRVCRPGRRAGNRSSAGMTAGRLTLTAELTRSTKTEPHDWPPRNPGPDRAGRDSGVFVNITRGRPPPNYRGGGLPQVEPDTPSCGQGTIGALHVTYASANQGKRCCGGSGATIRRRPCGARRSGCRAGDRSPGSTPGGTPSLLSRRTRARLPVWRG